MMLFSRYRLVVLLLLAGYILAALPSNSQQPDFFHITVEEGLSNRSVLSIAQDSSGFLWAGTMDGLNRYDGKSVKVYRSFYEANIMNPNIKITRLAAGKDNLWIGTNNGLYKYQLKEEQFVRCPLPSGATAQDSSIIRAICIYNDQVIVATSRQIVLIPPHNGAAGKQQLSALRVEGRALPNIQTLACDAAGNFFIGTSEGLYRTTLSRVIKNKSLQPELIAGGDITTIATDHGANTWIGTKNDGVFVLNNHFTLVKRFTTSLTSGQGLMSNVIRKILCTHDGNTWIGTLKGLNIYDPLKDSMIGVANIPDNAQSLNFNSIYDIQQDRQGNIWVGTFFGGLNIVNQYQTPFKVFQSNSVNNSISSNVISAIVGDRHHNLWVGTEAEGINYYDRQNSRFKVFKTGGSDNTISSNLIKSMLLDNKGRLWAGFFNGEINILEKDGRKIKRMRQTNLSPPPDADDIIALLQDTDGNIWIGNEEAGINIYNPSTGKFSLFEEVFPGYKLSSKAITALFMDSEKNIWVGTKNGLNLINHKRKTVSWLKKTAATPWLLSGYIYCISEDKNGVIWLGSYSGLSCYDPRDKKMNTYTTANGLPGNKVVGIIPDNNNNLWISTNNGISMLDTSRKIFRNYDVHDGLPGKAFNYNSFYKDGNGLLYFGSYNGLVSFDPAAIQVNTIPPKVELIHVLLNGEATHFKNKMEGDIPFADLKYDQNNLTISYAVLNFIKPEKNHSAYKLEGFDKNWISTGTHTAAYSNLPPGGYTLYVKAANNDGIWGSSQKVIAFTVLPPLWKTWWAYTLYFAAFLSSAIAITWFFNSRAALKRELIYEHALNVKQRELHQMKTDFFTHISHEIRTPLTLIMGPAEMLLENELDKATEKKLISSIKSNADRMLNLSNNLMDFIKADSGYTQLHPHWEDIVLFSQKVFDKFSLAARAKQINYRFHAAIPAISLYFDPHYMEIILFNLLSNAIKFAPQQGIVYLSVKKEQEGMVEISICDNGPGIPQESREKIFTQFFQADQGANKQAGTGIGLALTRLLVTLHGGSISFISNPGQAGKEISTCFIVSLKEGQNHLPQSDQV